MNKKNIQLLRILLLGLVFLIVTGYTVSADEEKDSFAGYKVEKTIDLGNGKSVEVRNNGLLLPVSNASELTDKQLDSALELMKFPKSDFSILNREVKVEIIENGGTYVPLETTDEEHVGIINGQERLLGNSVTNQPEFGVKSGSYMTNDISIANVTDGKFSGSSRMTYLGSTSTEYRYRVYLNFRWSSPPYHKGPDKFAMAWGSNAVPPAGTQYASVWTPNRPAPGTAYLPIRTDVASGAGTSWRFSPSSFNFTQGYGYQEIRIPRAHQGRTHTYASSYAHPYFSTNFSVSLGPASISWSGATGETWSWRNSFNVKAY